VSTVRVCPSAPLRILDPVD